MFAALLSSLSAEGEVDRASGDMRATGTLAFLDLLSILNVLDLLSLSLALFGSLGYLGVPAAGLNTNIPFESVFDSCKKKVSMERIVKARNVYSYKCQN